MLQSQLRTQLLEQLRKLAGPDAVKAPALTAAAAAAPGDQHAHARHKPDQGTGQVLPFDTAGAGAGAGAAASSSMWHAAMRWMLAEYLQASGCLFTLSVFRWGGRPCCDNRPSAFRRLIYHLTQHLTAARQERCLQPSLPATQAASTGAITCSTNCTLVLQHRPGLHGHLAAAVAVAVAAFPAAGLRRTCRMHCPSMHLTCVSCCGWTGSRRCWQPCSS